MRVFITIPAGSMLIERPAIDRIRYCELAISSVVDPFKCIYSQLPSHADHPLIPPLADRVLHPTNRICSSTILLGLDRNGIWQLLC